MIAWLLISFFVMLGLGVPIAMSLGLSAMDVPGLPALRLRTPSAPGGLAQRWPSR